MLFLVSSTGLPYMRIMPGVWCQIILKNAPRIGWPLLSRGQER